jgi:hypothetical protein
MTCELDRQINHIRKAVGGVLEQHFLRKLRMRYSPGLRPTRNPNQVSSKVQVLSAAGGRCFQNGTRYSEATIP